MEYLSNKINTFLGFNIGKEFFAIRAENVIEVLRKQGITSVPKTAEYIEGILHFRGDIISVVSAKKKLNVPNGEKYEKPVVIVIEFENAEKISKMGLSADKVIGVLNISENEIKPVMEFGNYYNPEFLKGAFNYKEKIVTILDLEKIFTQEEIEVIKDNETKRK